MFIEAEVMDRFNSSADKFSPTPEFQDYLIDLGFMVKEDPEDLPDLEKNVVDLVKSSRKSKGKISMVGGLSIMLWQERGHLIPSSRLNDAFYGDVVINGTEIIRPSISQLRKKLEKDPRIRITNVHGKGYKLETVD